MMNLTNSKVQEYRTAATLGAVIDNSFILKRIDDGQGGSAVAIATGAKDEDIVGVAHVQPLAALAAAVVGERHSVENGKVSLEFAPETSKVPVTVFGPNGAKIDTANVAVSGRVVTLTGVADDAAVTVNYLRSLTIAEVRAQGLPMDFANNLNGAGGYVEFATGKSTVEIDYFDTSAVFQVGKPVYASEDGLATDTPAEAGAAPIGTVAIAPNASYPLLGISFDLKF